MSLFDQRSFERTGTLAETEYNKLSLILAGSLKEIRVPTIRKGLTFQPYQFSRHLEEAKANYDARYAPIADSSFDSQLSTMPFYLAAPFRCEFFPDFMREYATSSLVADSFQMEYVPHEVGAAVLVPKEMFRSVVLSGYQIEQEVRKRYESCELSDEISTHIEIDCHFFLPAQAVIEGTDDMVLRLEVALIL